MKFLMFKHLIRLIEKSLPKRILIALLNIELMFRNCPDRISYSHTTKLFRIKSNDIDFFFARKQRALLYSKGLEDRIVNLARNYFLNDVNLSKKDIFVDCGANIGEVSFYVSQHSDCQIIVVEPEILEFQCLLRNLPAQRTKFFHGVLSDTNGIINFYSVPNSADSSIINPRETLLAGETYSWTMDQIFQNVNFEGVIGLKLEAEGAEPEVLLGSTQIMKRISFVTYDASPERGVEQLSTEKAVSEILLAGGFLIQEFNPDKFILYSKPIFRNFEKVPK